MKKPNSLLKYLATSAALLASSAYLFAAPSASAFSLIRGSDGRVEQIENLAVGEQLFNVNFILGRFDEIGSQLTQLETGLQLEVAEEIRDALGDEEFLFVTLEGSKRDSFRFFTGDFLPDGRLLVLGDRLSSLTEEDLAVFPNQPFFELTWANAVPVPPGDGGDSASTPEPTLILGFITLGGLMLGSKRKTKG